MGLIISPHQSAFVPDRFIQDSIIITHEAFHQMKINHRRKKKDMAIKFDFSKAYDRVEWDFLEEVVKKMGFDGKWIQWVMQCVTSVRFNIFANGENRGCVLPSRGLRQGDLLSPYLFFIVVDVLSKLISKAIEDQVIKGIRFSPSCPILSHLFFANDAILFISADKEECANMLKVLNICNEASG